MFEVVSRFRYDTGMIETFKIVDKCNNKRLLTEITIFYSELYRMRKKSLDQN